MGPYIKEMRVKAVLTQLREIPGKQQKTEQISAPLSEGQIPLGEARICCVIC